MSDIHGARGPCIVTSNVSWAMVKWGPLPPTPCEQDTTEYHPLVLACRFSAGQAVVDGTHQTGMLSC